MCGICGRYSAEGASPPDLDRMLRALAHRGPDDEGCYVGGCIALGSRRLSIIDLPGGRQPIANEDETIWIVSNGEIYNYQGLRAELASAGHRFRTRSDTEVILHLYEDLGDQCVERLSGMFAFALWDERQHKLLMARDRLGQKPLFYAWDGEAFLFASEIKAILAAWHQAVEVDYEAVHHYLSLRFIPSPQTMLRNIYKLPPAHYLVVERGAVKVARYWDISFNDKLDLSSADLVELLRERLAKAVAAHLISDVPVGAFLSGGLDSSMIVAMMAQTQAVPFKTFAVGVKERDFNELPYARMVADRYHTDHAEARVDLDLIGLLPRMIWHLDEPSDPIAACQYAAAELAAGSVKVVLGGDGGDELFAGFDRYLGLGPVDYYARLPHFVRAGLVGPVLESVPDSFTYKSLTQKLRWIQQLSLLAGTAERYAEATCFFRFNHEDKRRLYGDDLWRAVGGLNSAEVITRPFNSDRATDVVDRMLYADYQTRLPEHSLMLVDRLTMARGLELRSPYLDHELVELLAAFPSRAKLRGRQLKAVLRQLARDYLPPAIVRREKQGFMFPVAYWFRGELYPFVRAYLQDSYFVRQGLFQRDHVLGLVEEHRQGRVDHHVRLWMLLNLEIWHQLYVERRDIEAIVDNLRAYRAGRPHPAPATGAG